MARPAGATMLYLSEVPNATCTTCHVQNNVLDDFGVAVQAQLTASGTISWPGLFLRDTDGDGYSNGEELGDPCGVWTRGATPRFTNGITDPGDANSHPNQGTIGLCTGGSSSAPGSTSRPPVSSSVAGSGPSAGTSMAASSVGGSSVGSGESSSSVGGGSTAEPGSSSGNTTRRKTPAEQLGCGGNHAARETPNTAPAAVLLLVALRAATRRRRTR